MVQAASEITGLIGRISVPVLESGRCPKELEEFRLQGRQPALSSWARRTGNTIRHTASLYWIWSFTGDVFEKGSWRISPKFS